MILAGHNRFQDIRRTKLLGECLHHLDAKSFLFREAYNIGFPKFTDVAVVNGQPMTAYVGVDRQGRMVFVWGRQFFDHLCRTDWPDEFKQPLDRVAFVLAHETLHVVLRHVERAVGKSSYAWNLAADIVVNWLCQWYGLTVLPGSITADRYDSSWSIDPANQTTEQIYEILLNHAEVEFKPGSGHHDNWDSLDELTRKILGGKVTEAIEKAAQADEDSGRNEDPDWGDEDESPPKGCGSLPGSAALGELRQCAEQAITDYRIPWHQTLSRYLGSIYQQVPAERWDRLPTRIMSQWGRVILPSRRVDWRPVGVHILVALDASGSMTDEDVETMRRILRSLPSEYKVTLASFDTQCYIIESLDGVVGGGGTSLKDVNRVADELGVGCVICCTDGEFGSAKCLTRPDIWCFVINGSTRLVPEESQLIEMC